MQFLFWLSILEVGCFTKVTNIFLWYLLPYVKIYIICKDFWDFSKLFETLDVRSRLINFWLKFLYYLIVNIDSLFKGLQKLQEQSSSTGCGRFCLRRSFDVSNLILLNLLKKWFSIFSYDLKNKETSLLARFGTCSCNLIWQLVLATYSRVIKTDHGLCPTLLSIGPRIEKTDFFWSTLSFGLRYTVLEQAFSTAGSWQTLCGSWPPSG